MEKKPEFILNTDKLKTTLYSNKNKDYGMQQNNKNNKGHGAQKNNKFKKAYGVQKYNKFNKFNKYNKTYGAQKYNKFNKGYDVQNKNKYKFPSGNNFRFKSSFKRNLKDNKKFNMNHNKPWFRFANKGFGYKKRTFYQKRKPFFMVQVFKKKLKKISKMYKSWNLKRFELVGKNKIRDHLSFFVFHERYLKMFEQLLSLKNKNFDVFLDKLRVAETHLQDLRSFYFKEQKTFSVFLKKKKQSESRSISLLFKLVKIIGVINTLCDELQKKFATKFVGMRAFRLVEKFLDNFCYLYEYWLEFERAGIFNYMISFKNKVKLMRSFWYPKKKRRFLREPLWKSVCPDRNFVTDFKCIKRVGFSMSALKLTDDLFFWHAFTRKKINQNLWFFRSKKMFRNLAILRQNKALNKKVMIKIFNKIKPFSLILPFFKVVNSFFLRARKNVVLNWFFTLFKKSVQMVNLSFVKYYQCFTFVDKQVTKMVGFFQNKKNFSFVTMLNIKLNCILNLVFFFVILFNFKGFFSSKLYGFFVSKFVARWFYLKTQNQMVINKKNNKHLTNLILNKTENFCCLQQTSRFFPVFNGNFLLFAFFMLEKFPVVEK